MFFTFSQIKQFATQKQFRKFNRQYLKNQQTVLSAPVSPCQTVLRLSENHARQLRIFSAFYSPLKNFKPLQDEQEINDSVGNSEGMGDGTPMSQYNSRGGGAARSVVNRIGVRMEELHNLIINSYLQVNQDRWRRQVEVQRSSVYDRHSLLN